MVYFTRLRQRISPLRGGSVYLGGGRYLVLFLAFLLAGCLVLIRFITYNLSSSPVENNRIPPDVAARPDIVDRNGLLLATDIQTFSLYADPRKILDPDEAVELLLTILPNLNAKDLYKKLTSGSSFAWIERGLTPSQKRSIFKLGIPGIAFRTEIRRFYPAGRQIAHVVGLVDIDNNGIGGIEKYIDTSGLSILRAQGLIKRANLEKVSLSLDLRVQSLVHNIVESSLAKFQAIAAGAVILDIATGEVLALVSIPDYDPNTPASALKAENLNRMTAGVYEMGSTMKSFTTAMTLDTDGFGLNSIFDASKPLVFGKQVIHDYHGKNRPLKLWEVFIYSSNIGSAQEVKAVGIEQQKNFLSKLGLLSKLQTELPEVATPIVPKVWREVNAATISFGHGLATTPLQTAVAAAALVNGGYLLKPTFLKQERAEPKTVGTQVIKASTSEKMRYLDWLNGNVGSGKLARVAGYRVGGKTGTAEKVVNGKYVSSLRFNSYLASFPIDAPRYLVLTIIDEPKKFENDLSATAAYNAGRMAAEIIERTAFYLGVLPDATKEGVPPILPNEEKPQ